MLEISYIEPIPIVKPLATAITSKKKKRTDTYTNIYHFTDDQPCIGSYKCTDRTHQSLSDQYHDEFYFAGEVYGRLPHGKGHQYYDTGNYYHGDYTNGSANGVGIEYDVSRNETYCGDFKNGRRHGWGTYIYDDGGRYVGEFSNGKYVNSVDDIYYDPDCRRYRHDTVTKKLVPFVRRAKACTNIPGVIDRDTTGTDRDTTGTDRDTTDTDRDASSAHPSVP